MERGEWAAVGVLAVMAMALLGLVAVGVIGWLTWLRRRDERIARRGRFAMNVLRDLADAQRYRDEVDRKPPSAPG